MTFLLDAARFLAVWIAWFTVGVLAGAVLLWGIWEAGYAL